LQDKISQYRSANDRQYRENYAEYLYDTKRATKGNSLFDPTKINPKFKDIQEHSDAGAIGWAMPSNILYMLPEWGSSYADFEDMAALMATDKAAGFISTKVLPNVAGGAYMKAGQAMIATVLPAFQLAMTRSLRD